MFNFKVVGVETQIDPVTLLTKMLCWFRQLSKIMVSLNCIENRARRWTLCDATKNIRHKWVGYNY